MFSFFFQGLLLYKLPRNQTRVLLPPSPWAKPPLCALKAVPALHSSDAARPKVKTTESHLPKCPLTLFLDLLCCLNERKDRANGLPFSHY